VTFLDLEQQFLPLGVDHHIEVLALLRGTGEGKYGAMRVV
jgi:hypothetical protein